MAITSIGALGTAVEQSTDRSTSCSYSRSVAVGRVVVTWLGVDNTFSVFDPTNGENFWYPTDSQGNIFSTLLSVTDARSFHGTGGQIIIAITQIRNAVTTSDSVTWQSDPALEPGFAYVRCISLEEFDFDGMRWAASGSMGVGRRDDAAQPGSLTKTFNASREWLMLHGLALEGPNTDTFTWDSDYTQIVPVGTNTGTVTDDITLHGGFRVATLSTDTVAVTNNTSSTRDSTQGLVGVCAVPQKPGFPVNPVLDDFNRANENPLSAAAGWNTTTTAHFGGFAQVISNQAAGSGGSFWDTTFDNCVEVYATAMNGTGGALDGGLSIHASGSSTVPSLDGNSVVYYKGNNAITSLSTGRTGNQGLVSWCIKSWPILASGDSYGLQRTLGLTGAVGVNHTWVKFGAGAWEEIGAYALDYGDGQGEFTTGKLILACYSGRYDNFGGGEFPCGKRFRPQIYRRAYGDR